MGLRAKILPLALGAAILTLEVGCATPEASPPAGETVRMIVELELPAPPPAELAKPEVARAYAQTIAKAQDDLLQALAGQEVKNVRRFRLIAGMGIEVRPQSLSTILAQPQVRLIRPDRENQPLGTQ